MVVELLTFEVDPDERDAWLATEERVWSRYLERQPGFVAKQMWVEEGDEGRVHAVIWWESREQWKAITAEEVARVDADMGAWLRPLTARELRVVRDR